MTTEQERTDYIEHCQEYDLEPEWLDQTFSPFGIETYKIVGLNLRALIYKVCAIDIESGKPKRFELFVIRNIFNKKYK